MENTYEYLMESAEEATRLEMKTDPEAVRTQSLWCGLKPGMRVLDLGCGTGKTSAVLHALAQPGGSVVGVDFSPERIRYARRNYGDKEGIAFFPYDFTGPLHDMRNEIGKFDFIWVRFVLEYYLRESCVIVRNLMQLLNPGGLLCLLDLDYNFLSHYELPEPIGAVLPKLAAFLAEKHNFDVYAGRKLYSYLYDAGYEDIQVNLAAHHLIHGRARDEDVFNWMKKVEVAARKATAVFEHYPGGYAAFAEDFKAFFLNPRRFTYTPLIMCKGMRPLRD